ncbi:alpha/beta hydrolase [Wenyingzhuangia sp. IMCC45533]
MKKLVFIICLLSTLFVSAQKTVKLPCDKAEGFTWKGGENEYFSERWKSHLITNVSKPTIEIYQPKKELNNGTTVIIAPGGALYALSIVNEGRKVAEWLNNKGITAVVLKYRLIPTYTKDGIIERQQLQRKDKTLLQKQVSQLIPYSIQDALNAVDYMRSNADKHEINPNKIGFMGFSAGGSVTMGVAYHYTEKNRPDFIVPVYPWVSKYPVQKPKADAPPMIVFCASDDQLNLALGNVELYKSWKENNLNASIHLFAKGRHGFGMKTQNLPSDKWINIFYDWAISEGFVNPIKI